MRRRREKRRGEEGEEEEEEEGRRGGQLQSMSYIGWQITPGESINYALLFFFAPLQ